MSFQGLSNSTNLVQIQSGRTVPSKGIRATKEYISSNIWRINVYAYFSYSLPIFTVLRSVEEPLVFIILYLLVLYVLY